MSEPLVDAVESHLGALVSSHPDRHPGRPGNRAANDASSGEHLFVAENEGRWEEIVGTVDMDAIGARGAGTALSMYGVTDAGREIVRRVLRRHPSVTMGEAWYESDHSIVAGHGRPAVALTSTNFRELCATVTHTERDTLEVVDPAVVAAAAEFVADLIRALPAEGGPEA